MRFDTKKIILYWRIRLALSFFVFLLALCLISYVLVYNVENIQLAFIILILSIADVLTLLCRRRLQNITREQKIGRETDVSRKGR